MKRFDFSKAPSALARRLPGLRWSAALLDAGVVAAAAGKLPAPGALFWALVAPCAVWQAAMISVAASDRLAPAAVRSRAPRLTYSACGPLHREDQP